MLLETRTHMLKLDRPVGLVLGVGLLALAGVVMLAQTPKPQAVDLSKEWPTYGHDPGGMRYSPLTQITPANVSQLKVAWVYHMRPAGAVAPAAPVAPAGRGADAVEGETPAGVQGRGRGRGGSGLR